MTENKNYQTCEMCLSPNGRKRTKLCDECYNKKDGTPMATDEIIIERATKRFRPSENPQTN